MFGYVKILDSELKVKDYKRYRAFYCGLCKELREKYGHSGQMTLTYDMTFAVILLTSLYEKEIRHEKCRCKMHPLKRQDILRSEFTTYAADMNVLLAYYHFRDDWSDEKKIGGLAGTLAFRRKAKKIIQKYPGQAAVIRKELQELSRLEASRVTEIDLPAGCFGRLMSGLFRYKKDQWAETLGRMGFYLGKFIYIMDAYDDLEKDRKSGSYNPLLFLNDDLDFEQKCRDMLCMMIAECCGEFEKLPCVLDIDILRNILYDGIWSIYRKKQQMKGEDISDEQKSL